MTYARRLVLATLHNHQTERHLTAESLYLQLHALGNALGLATIYRILADFMNVGLVKRNYFLDGRAYFELARDEWHVHLIDSLTGTIIEVSDGELRKRLSDLAQQLGYELVDQQVTMYIRPRAV